MKPKLYSLFDRIAEQYGPIFQAVNNATAIRSVQNMKIRSYEDFQLYLVGEWDMESGEISSGHKTEIEWVTPTYASEMKAEKLQLIKGGQI